MLRYSADIKTEGVYDADKNFDNVMAAKELFDRRFTASNFILITCRSPIYTTTLAIFVPLNDRSPIYR